MMPHMSSKEMFSSWPNTDLVDGVKMGCGSRSLSLSRPGSGRPQMVPSMRYSFQPEPAR